MLDMLRMMLMRNPQMLDQLARSEIDPSPLLVQMTQSSPGGAMGTVAGAQPIPVDMSGPQQVPISQAVATPVAPPPELEARTLPPIGGNVPLDPQTLQSLAKMFAVNEPQQAAPSLGYMPRPQGPQFKKANPNMAVGNPARRHSLADLLGG